MEIETEAAPETKTKTKTAAATAIRVRAEGEPWVPIARGVDLKVLRASEETGAWTTLVRFTPRGVLPRHWHLSASEFYVLEGAGNHPQAGDFEPGDYFYEHNGAFHDEVTTDEEVILYMVSHGPSAFIASDDSVSYVMDAGSIKEMVRREGRLGALFIVKAAVRSGLSRLFPLPPFATPVSEAATRVQTGALPWLRLSEGVDAKVLHIGGERGNWSALVRLKPGSGLPRRRQLAAAELYVVKGTGNHPQAGALTADDYVFEPAGAICDEVTADEEVLLFMVSHGPSAFVDADGSVRQILDAGALRRMSQN
jgi:quercetin dioxygenase-like cupin family protein